MKMKIKIKSLKQIGSALIVSTLLISCNNTEEPPNGSVPPTRAELKKAVSTLKRFGDKISTGKLTQEDKLLIKELSNTPAPMAVFINQNAVLTAGINFESQEDVVFNSVTGKLIDACKITYENEKRSIKANAIPKCKTRVIPPNDAVKLALSTTKPIKGKILKDGREVDAIYTLGLTVTHVGSYCYTRIILGKQKEVCYTF